MYLNLDLLYNIYKYRELKFFYCKKPNLYVPLHAYDKWIEINLSLQMF